MTPMNELIGTVLPMLVVFSTIYLVIKLIMDYTTRNKLIEKGVSGDDVKTLLQTTARQSGPSSLKWGLVLLLVGLALVAIRLFEDITDEAAFGMTLIAAGAGLLIYYFINPNKAAKINGN